MRCKNQNRVWYFPWTFDFEHFSLQPPAIQMYITDIDVNDLMMRGYPLISIPKNQKHGTNWIGKIFQIQQLEIWLIS